MINERATTGCLPCATRARRSRALLARLLALNCGRSSSLWPPHSAPSQAARQSITATVCERINNAETIDFVAVVVESTYFYINHHHHHHQAPQSGLRRQPPGASPASAASRGPPFHARRKRLALFPQTFGLTSRRAQGNLRAAQVNCAPV